MYICCDSEFDVDENVLIPSLWLHEMSLVHFNLHFVAEEFCVCVNLCVQNEKYYDACPRRNVL